MPQSKLPLLYCIRCRYEATRRYVGGIRRALRQQCVSGGGCADGADGIIEENLSAHKSVGVLIVIIAVGTHSIDCTRVDLSLA
jgi:hypothetical protein